jgi:hypothetical protein
LENCVGATWTTIGATTCPGKLAAVVRCDAPVFQVRNTETGDSVVSLGSLQAISGQLETRVQSGSSWSPICASSWNGTAATVCSKVFQLHASSEGNSTECLMWKSCGGSLHQCPRSRCFEARKCWSLTPSRFSVQIPCPARIRMTVVTLIQRKMPRCSVHQRQVILVQKVRKRGCHDCVNTATCLFNRFRLIVCFDAAVDPVVDATIVKVVAGIVGGVLGVVIVIILVRAWTKFSKQRRYKNSALNATVSCCACTITV